MKSNKFQEKCFECQEVIPVGRGTFRKVDDLWRIFCAEHKTDKVVEPIVPEVRIINPEHEYVFEHIEKFRFSFLKVIYRTLRTFLPPNKKQNLNFYKELADEIFDISIMQLREKMIKKGNPYESESYIRRSFRIYCFNETCRAVRRFIDEQWYRKLSPTQRKLGMSPPSVLYMRRYRDKNKERINARRRERYITVPKLKDQRKKKYMKSKIKKIAKRVESEHRLFLAWQKWNTAIHTPSLRKDTKVLICK